MKGLKPRAYNILFHTHTVSGIVISFVLFIIFFSGAIALYKQEFYQWEDPSARIPVVDSIHYEGVLQQMDAIRPGAATADEVTVVMPTTAQPVYKMYAPVKDSSGTAYTSFTYNPVSGEVAELYKGNGTTTGETLYRLHFLDQVPWYIGRYIAGFVALFFAFATITGVLIHWKNIVSKFYAFSFKDVRKQFWTNGHTVFGIIGLPFQLMYAITGAFYLLSILVLVPAVTVLFKGDQEKLITMIYPAEAFHSHHEGDSLSKPAQHMPIAAGVQQIRGDYPHHTIAYLQIINPGRENAALVAELADEDRFSGNGTVVLDLQAGTYKMELKPGEKNYIQSVLLGIGKLHFGNFAGALSKALYFILSIFTCFVIISGVLMWKEARNKPRYTDKQRRFHHRVTMVYLSVCFSLFPATALLFASEHWVPPGMGHSRTVNTLFFGGWLVLAIAGCLLKSEKRLTWACLLLGGVLACMVPVANGWVTGDWFWMSAGKNSYVFMTDIVWLLTGLLCLLFSRKVRAF